MNTNQEIRAYARQLARDAERQAQASPASAPAFEIRETIDWDEESEPNPLALIGWAAVLIVVMLAVSWIAR